MRSQRSNMFDNDKRTLERTLPILNSELGESTFLLSSMLSIILRASVKSPRRQCTLNKPMIEKYPRVRYNGLDPYSPATSLSSLPSLAARSCSFI
jgi:hypothetical protein